MADNDYNAVKPVDSLHNVTGLSPVKQRHERRRRQNLHSQNEKQPEEESAELPDSQSRDEEVSGDGNDQHSIDYRA
jgi:hypothetical protein